MDANQFQIAAELLTNCLPFLTRGLCGSCIQTLSGNILSLRTPNPTSNMNMVECKGNCSTGADTDFFGEEEESSKHIQMRNDFMCLERIDGKPVNILAGLELHQAVFTAAEQHKIVCRIQQLQKMGEGGNLKGHTYAAPPKWMRGKGRATLQFGCFYNFAKDNKGNLPGILESAVVEPLPDIFRLMIRRLVMWHILPPYCVPDSCIVNIYEQGDCIPPHIDNHNFLRPFCTVSFLSECNILFGSKLKIVGPGEFLGSYEIPLPLGSVLVFNGNGANVAKHCIPAVPSKRISITFRRMDESKRPIDYAPEPLLLKLQPLAKRDKRSSKHYSSRTAAVGRDKGNSRRTRQGPPKRRRFQNNADLQRNDSPRLPGKAIAQVED